jgi:hypothetical protein
LLPNNLLSFGYKYVAEERRCPMRHLIIGVVMVTAGCSSLLDIDGYTFGVDGGEEDDHVDDPTDTGEPIADGGDSDSDSDSDGDSDIDSDADSDADADADSDSDTNTGSDTGDTDTWFDTDTGGDVDADTDSDSDADTDVDGDSDADTDTDADADTDTGTSSDTGVDSDSGSDTGFDTSTDTESSTEVGCMECMVNSGFPCACEGVDICDDGSLCFYFGEEEKGACLRPCEGATDCGLSSDCAAVPACQLSMPDQAYCGFMCEEDSDCPSDMGCDFTLAVGVCYPT